LREKERGSRKECGCLDEDEHFVPSRTVNSAPNGNGTKTVRSKGKD
jgi:hypothetical protein